MTRASWDPLTESFAEEIPEEIPEPDQPTQEEWDAELRWGTPDYGEPY